MNFKGIFSKRNVAIWFILISFTMLFGTLTYFVPYAFDDLMFRNLYYEHSHGEHLFSFKTLYHYALDIRANDNGRLSNVLCGPFVIFFPKWTVALLSGIGFALMFWLLNFVAGVSGKHRPYFIVLTCFFSFVFLPLRDHIFLCDYILNYVFPSVFILSFVWILDRAQSGELSTAGMLGGLVVGIIGAWFHEGFAVPICFGLAAFCIYKKFCATWKWWVLAIVFGLVSLWVALAPGVLLRANNEFNGLSIIDKIKTTVTQFPAVILLSIFLIVSLRKKTFASIRHKLLSNSVTFVCSFAAFAGYIIVLSVDSDPRASWPTELLAMVSLVFILSKFDFTLLKSFRYLAIVCYVLSCLLLTNTIIWQKRFFVEYNEISRLLSESPNGTVFYDITDPRNARWPTFGIATGDFWINDWQYMCLPDNVHKHYSVVPSALQNFSVEASRFVEGADSLLLYRGILVGPEINNQNPKNGFLGDIITYRFGTGNRDGDLVIPCFCNPFIGPDDKKYTYIRPLYPIDGHIKSAERIR